jgi:hypothetical protein
MCTCQLQKTATKILELGRKNKDILELMEVRGSVAVIK